ncbi:protein disulfide-isomerase A5-like [Watersipora subatra]|uniref:protein disulfide-isomerase A5-like n=1 Tax=Watersipora subatra TaxID=2589382 RepID=UPI00355B9097
MKRLRVQPLVCFGVLIICSCILPFVEGAKKNGLIEQVYDIKDFKKLLRTRNNVLVLYMKSNKSNSKVLREFERAAEEMKGKATICSVDCGDAAKLCKKMKVSPEPLIVHHYLDNKLNKAYDRALASKSIVSFLEDPTGDMPWDEDTTARDVLHVSSTNEFRKLVEKSKKPILAMFYAPWCGHCKRLKPEFAAAATEVKTSNVLVGINADKPALSPLRTVFNITGYPTLFYFSKGNLLFKYGGENDKEGIVEWLKNPSEPKEPEKEVAWSEKENDVHHLSTETFDEFLNANPSVLVMFYAPWCGHCKKMKPDYETAATALKDEGEEGKLAAVDATESTDLGERYGVKGFPTVIYFRDGIQMWQVSARTADKIIEFMKNPEEPPPPPAPEASWSEVESNVVHLTNENFASVIKKKKYSLVMFYAPWCGHCKKAKPHYTAAAAQFTEDPKKLFAAVDCTEHQDVCGKYEVKGYPTFITFNYGKNEQPYNGGREEADFVGFMNDPENPQHPTPPVQEDMWANTAGAENVHMLTDGDFDDFMAENPSVLVMFYAPWCGHCKNMKPDFAAAATQLKEDGAVGVLAAVDATKESAVSNKYDVKGFPALKYFQNGEFIEDYSEGRTKQAVVDYMKSSFDMEGARIPDPARNDDEL